MYNGWLLYKLTAMTRLVMVIRKRFRFAGKWIELDKKSYHK